MGPKGGGPKGGGPKGGGRRVGAEGWGSKISRFFFPLSPPDHFILSVSLCGVFSWNFGGVFESGGIALMCAFGVLGLSCEAPAAPKPGEREEERNVGERGKKKASLWVWGLKIWPKH